MAETHQVVTKVWIAPGCIVCDACENDCPEVFDVQEETCVIRPPALKAEFLAPLTPSIITAAEGCPVDVIKFETKEVEGPAPWAGREQPVGAATTAAGAEAKPHAGTAAAKKDVPLGPPDPKWQALISTSKISPSLSAGLATTVRKSPEVVQAEEIVRTVQLPKNAPPDQRAAILAAGGAYAPPPSLAERIRRQAAAAREAARSTRREFDMALVAAWGLMAAAGVTCAAMFQDFFAPKVLKEPKKVWKVGTLEEYTKESEPVNEKFKRTPAGSEGFWIVYLADERKVVAISTICTHLGCIPYWLPGELKYKCPCHGSGYYMNGINFEGPTPRPLERFKIYVDPSDGQLVVDQTVVFRQELGEWENTDSFVPV